MVSDEMFASAACTTCSFFQVWVGFQKVSPLTSTLLGLKPKHNLDSIDSLIENETI